MFLIKKKQTNDTKQRKAANRKSYLKSNYTPTVGGAWPRGGVACDRRGPERSTHEMAIFLFFFCKCGVNINTSIDMFHHSHLL